MSDRPREQLPPDSFINRGYDAVRPSHTPLAGPATDQYGPRTVGDAPKSASPALLRHTAGDGRTRNLPPLPQAPNVSGGSFSPASRSVGVASILNPVDPDEQAQSRRRKASQLESPSSSMSILPPLGMSHQGPQSAAATPTTSSMLLSGPYGGERPRRILTPRSPSLHRAASLNQINYPSAPTFSAQHAPFAVSPRSRSYAIEPGTAGALPLPTPPAGLRQGYGFPAPTPSNNPPASSRGTSAGLTRGMRPPSESTSPRSSYSSYSQADQASPAASYAPSSMPTLSSAYPTGPEQSSLDRHRQAGVPISSSGGQNVYQMMTLETTSGTVQLPVDVQAASRVADEKRRRNAGASARFRQRRKEKEKEASTTISRLEQQVKEIGEDMDFYKRERDYLAGVVLQVPGGDRHFPRPQSPRHRRSSTMVGSSNSGYLTMHEHGARSPDEDRNVRRRTSTLSLPPPSQPPQLANPHPPPGSGYQSSYAPQGYGQPLAPQPQPQVHQPPVPLPSPLSRGPLPAPTPPGPSLMQAAPQTGPWNPYAERRGPGQPQPPPSQHRDNR